jgi:hypothetical protein
MPSAPNEVQQVYQLNWGVACAIIRSGIVTILACLDLFHAWILITYLLDHAGISPQQRTIIIVMNAPVDERIGHWNVVKKQYKEVEYVPVKITKLVIFEVRFYLFDVLSQFHILPLIPLSYPEKENRQAQGRKWKSKWI